MENPVEEKHSRLGIASFVTSIAIAILMAALFAVAGILHSYPHEGAYPGQTIVGVLIIFLFFADMAAVGLGIASICQKEGKKVLGILGLSFSSLTILGTIGLIILGLKVSGKL